MGRSSRYQNRLRRYMIGSANKPALEADLLSLGNSLTWTTHI